MPAPSTPSVSLTRLSDTAFTALIHGDAGVTHRLYYSPTTGTGSFQIGPTQVGDGTMTVTGLAGGQAYFVYVISDNGQFSLPYVTTISLLTTDSIIGAFVAKFQGSPSLIALVPGGIWTGEIPEDTPLPYAYCEVSESRYHQNFGDDYFEGADVMVHIFANGADAAETAAQAMRPIFEYKPIAFKRGTLIHCRQDSYEINSEVGRYKDGTLIYQAKLTYDILVQR
jgi:hypothetical protein